MCGRIIGEKGVVAITSFLNDNGLLFRFSFNVRGIGIDMKSGGRRVNRGNLSLTVLKVQNILLYLGMEQNGLRRRKWIPFLVDDGEGLDGSVRDYEKGTSIAAVECG